MHDIDDSPPTTSTPTTTLGISASDAAATAGSDNKFSSGEQIIRIEHLTGGAINWSKMTKLQCMIIGSDISYTLKVLFVKGVEYSSSNAVSTPGEVIILGISGDQTIPAGSYLVLTIAGNNCMWKSPDSGFIVN